MNFTKRSLTQSETNRITSKIKRIYKNKINTQKLDTVSNEDGTIIFGIAKEYRGREPYNEYILLVKQETFLISAETFWDVKKYNNISYLRAWFIDTANPKGYSRNISEKINKITLEFSDLANEALAALSDEKQQFNFIEIDKI